MTDRDGLWIATGSRAEIILGIFCLAGVVCLAFLASYHTLTGVDVFWHLKTGEIILHGRSVPHEDVFSFTRHGSEWIDAQWLFQAAIYALYKAAGYRGMIIFSASIAALTWLLIILNWRPRKSWLLSALVGFISLIAASSRLKLRPEALSFFFIALEMYLLYGWRRGGKAGLYIVPPLILVWANSEGLWPIGIFILAAFLAEELLHVPAFGLTARFSGAARESGWSRVFGLFACLAVSAALVFLNPYGVKGALFPIALFREISFPGSFLADFIGEFQSPFTRLPWLDLAAYILIILVSLFALGRDLNRRALPAASIIIWAAFLYLSVVSLRNVALFAVVAAMITGAVQNGKRKNENKIFERLAEFMARHRMYGAACLAVILILAGADIVTSRFFIRNQSYVRFGTGALKTEFPMRASDFLKSACRAYGIKRLKIFNDLDSAGYLIWQGWPDWQVYADPRLEVYGQEFFRKYSTFFTDYEAFLKEDERYGFDVVFLSPVFKNKAFAQAVNADARWSLAYMDGLNAVFIKKASWGLDAVKRYGIDLRKNLPGAISVDEPGPAWFARESFGRGSMLLIMDAPESALPELQATYRADPDDPNILFYLGWTLKTLRRYDDAKPHLEKVAKKHPDFLANRIQLAELYAQTGEVEKAISEFQDILAASPLELQACVDLAKIYEKVEKEKALAQWQRCRDICLADPARCTAGEHTIRAAIERLERQN